MSAARSRCSDMAAPTKFTDALAEEICERIANGESLRFICADAHMPALNTVRRWLADDRYAAFRSHYARAREDQADFYADEIVEIADTEEDAQRARVRIDARKWKASKLVPKKYGDRQMVDMDLNVSGDVVLAALDALRNRRAS